LSRYRGSSTGPSVGLALVVVAVATTILGSLLYHAVFPATDRSATGEVVAACAKLGDAVSPMARNRAVVLADGVQVGSASISTWLPDVMSDRVCRAAVVLSGLPQAARYEVRAGDLSGSVATLYDGVVIGLSTSSSRG
jgi:hypothetical protein